MPVASLFPGRAENKLFIIELVAGYGETRGKGAGMGLSPDNSSELCCGLAAVIEDNPACPLKLTLVPKCAPTICPTEHTEAIDSAHWPFNRGCALPIGPGGTPRRGNRRTLLHEVAGTIQQSFMFIIFCYFQFRLLHYLCYCH